MTDPIADMLTRIRNAVQGRHPRVDVPTSRFKAEIARILEQEGYIHGFKLLDADGETRPVIRISLKYGPRGEKVTVKNDAVEVKGPKGSLTQRVPPGVKFEVKGAELLATLERPDPQLSKFHGLARSLMANAVAGVTDGFKKELDIVGVGYRAELKGKQVIFALGYSHAVVFDVPTGIDIVIDKQTHITVTGVDRQLVGQVAANIRRLREPDPYKQKGVRYTGEVLKKKAGKTGAK